MNEFKLDNLINVINQVTTGMHSGLAPVVLGEHHMPKLMSIAKMLINDICCIDKRWLKYEDAREAVLYFTRDDVVNWCVEAVARNPWLGVTVGRHLPLQRTVDGKLLYTVKQKLFDYLESRANANSPDWMRRPPPEIINALTVAAAQLANVVVPFVGSVAQVMLSTARLKKISAAIKAALKEFSEAEHEALRAVMMRETAASLNLLFDKEEGRFTSASTDPQGDLSVFRGALHPDASDWLGVAANGRFALKFDALEAPFAGSPFSLTTPSSLLFAYRAAYMPQSEHTQRASCMEKYDARSPNGIYVPIPLFARPLHETVQNLRNVVGRPFNATPKINKSGEELDLLKEMHVCITNTPHIATFFTAELSGELGTRDYVAGCGVCLTARIMLDRTHYAVAHKYHSLLNALGGINYHLAIGLLHSMALAEVLAERIDPYKLFEVFTPYKECVGKIRKLNRLVHNTLATCYVSGEYNNYLQKVGFETTSLGKFLMLIADTANRLYQLIRDVAPGIDEVCAKQADVFHLTALLNDIAAQTKTTKKFLGAVGAAVRGALHTYVSGLSGEKNEEFENVKDVDYPLTERAQELLGDFAAHIVQTTFRLRALKRNNDIALSLPFNLLTAQQEWVPSESSYVVTDLLLGLDGSYTDLQKIKEGAAYMFDDNTPFASNPCMAGLYSDVARGELRADLWGLQYNERMQLTQNYLALFTEQNKTRAIAFVQPVISFPAAAFLPMYTVSIDPVNTYAVSSYVLEVKDKYSIRARTHRSKENNYLYKVNRQDIFDTFTLVDIFIYSPTTSKYLSWGNNHHTCVYLDDLSDIDVGVPTKSAANSVLQAARFI